MNDLLSGYGLLGWSNPYRQGIPLENPTESFEQPEFNQFVDAFNKLPEEEQKIYLDKLSKGVQAFLGGSSFGNNQVKGYAGIGRLGYNLPTDDGMLSGGVTGTYSNIKPEEIGSAIKNASLTGADIGYKFGPNELKLSYNKVAPLQVEGVNLIPPIMVKNLVNLLYNREF